MLPAFALKAKARSVAWKRIAHFAENLGLIFKKIDLFTEFDANKVL
jgi:hypothetical protein